MTDIFGFYVGSFLSTTIVILLFLLIRFLFRRKANTQICMIWVILLIRLLCPVSIETAWGVKDPIHETVNYETQAANERVTVSNPADNQSNESGNIKRNDNYIKYIEYIWYIGIGIIGSYYLIQSLLIYKKRKNARILEEYGDVREWTDFTGACVIGVLKPSIYLPGNLSDNLKKVIISHERMHIKRRDYLFVFFYYIALMLNWYNPLVWVVYAIVLQDVERACDEDVLRNRTLDERKNYAYSLIQIYNENYKKNSFTHTLGFSKKAVKRRIEDIGIRKPKNKKTAVLIIICCCLVLTGGMYFYQMHNYNREMQQIGDDMIGSDLPEFIYADDRYVDFYDYHGIYVYDTQKSEIYRYITFAELEVRGQTQGDNAVQVYASINGKNLYIISGKMQYVYDIRKNKLKQYNNDVIKTDMFQFKKTEEDVGNSIGGQYIYGNQKVYWSYSVDGTGLYQDLELNIDKGGDKTVYTIFKK